MKTSFSTLRLLLFISTFLLSFLGKAQTLSGTLIDKESGESIPFADIQIGTDYGVISNTEGKFIINTKAFPATDSLQFSGMGYQQKSIALGDYHQDTVYLSPKTNKLATVYLVDQKLTARQIMDSVKKNRINNYSFGSTQMTIFRRSKNSMTPKKIQFKIKKARNMIRKNTLKRFNKTVDSFSRASKNNTATTYRAFLGKAAFNKKDSLKIQLHKATSLVNKDREVGISDFVGKILSKLGREIKTSNTFKVRTGILPLGDSVDVSKDINFNPDSVSTDSVTSKQVKKHLWNVLQQITFRRSVNGIAFTIGGTSEENIVTAFVEDLDDYDYKIEGSTIYNNDFVYIISFKPHHNFFGNKGKFTGTLYVAADSYAVVKETYHLAKGELGKKFRFKFLLGVKYVEQAKSGTIIFKKNEAGRYIPKYVQLAGRNYAYFSRNFVFKENGKSRRERIKMKLKITLEFNSTYQNEWVFTNIKPISNDAFSQFENNKGVINQTLENYNPKIWKNDNPLAPTEAIKEYNGAE